MAKVNKVEALYTELSKAAIEKKIPEEIMLDCLKKALEYAFNQNMFIDEVDSRCEIDRDKGKIYLFHQREVVEKVEQYWEDLQISLEEANSKGKLKYNVGDVYEDRYELSDILKRSTARGFIDDLQRTFNQNINKVNKELILSEFKEKEGKITTGIVKYVEVGKFVQVDLKGFIGVMPYSETIPEETYNIDQEIKVYVKEVGQESKKKGKDAIVLSRRDARFLVKLFEAELPEIAEGKVYIRNIARLPGKKTKIVVSSNEKGLDAAGTFIGKAGTRISKIVEQLANGKEKIDVIEYYDDPLMTIKACLSPARVAGIGVREEEIVTKGVDKVTKKPTTFKKLGKVADVVVSNEDFSVAIGVKGYNAFLTKKLSKFDKVNIIRVDDALGKVNYRRMEDIEREYYARINGTPIENIPVVNEELINKEIDEVSEETSIEETVEVSDNTVISTPTYVSSETNRGPHISVVEETKEVTKKEENKTEDTTPSKKAIKKEEEAAKKAIEEESKKKGMAIYTEEELKAFEEEEIEEDEDIEDEDYDDSYDHLYDEY